MDKNYIKIGKKKVIEQGFEDQLEYLDDTFLDILGRVSAEYFGTGNMKRFDEYPDLYSFCFYEFVDDKLIECGLDAVRFTAEYEENDLLIFSQAPEGEREYYVMNVIKE